MVFSMFTIIPAVTADAASGISYIDEHGEEQTADNVTVINSATTTLDDGWYAVNSDITISGRITCSGGVNLILCDNAELTVPNGILVNESDAGLTIYSQSKGENKGKLTINSAENSDDAAIGGVSARDSGLITINGGDISVTTVSADSAAIGGGSGAIGTVTINGGKVTVNRRYADVSYGAGIGSGYKGIAEVFINKGDVTVNDIGNGTINGAAIGAASNSDLRNRVVINDGNITVGQSGSGIYNAAGIGGGAQGSIGNINILAGQISAHSQNGFGIGAGKISENESGQTGNIVLGYSNQSNFIEADSFGTDASKISFYSEKEFIIDGTNTLATAESILSGCKLIPKIVGNYSLEYTKVSGVNDKYPYTGSEITIKPVLTDINGTTLNENYHYKVTLTYGDKQVDKVKALAGVLLETSLFGLHGWQELFILEALPALLSAGKKTVRQQTGSLNTARTAAFQRM